MQNELLPPAINSETVPAILQVVKKGGKLCVLIFRHKYLCLGSYHEKTDVHGLKNVCENVHVFLFYSPFAQTTKICVSMCCLWGFAKKAHIVYHQDISTNSP